jgi:hypothetical protein
MRENSVQVPPVMCSSTAVRHAAVRWLPQAYDAIPSQPISEQPGFGEVSQLRGRGGAEKVCAGA